MDQSEQRFFTMVYRLAQQSVEGFAFWKELLPYLKLHRGKYWNAVLTNEELLRIIITNTKRSFVVTTFILCDDSKHGKQGHSVHQLLKRCRTLPGLDIDAEKGFLVAAKTARRIEQIRILRNNLDAHHAASDEWKRRFGTLQNSEIEELISTVYGIVFRCNKAAGMRRVSENSLRKASTVYAERLLRALEKQAKDRGVGRGFVSVDQWETEAMEESEP
jgi:hypothetical protein